MLATHHDTLKHVWRDDPNMRNMNFKWVPHGLSGYKVPESDLISGKAAQTEVWQTYTPGIKCG
jgi:hypothetical protein